MSIMKFLKIGGKPYMVADKPKKTKREVLREIHAMMCCAESDEPIAVQQKFEKINVNQYTDAQVTRILKNIKALTNEVDKSQKK